MSTKRKQDEVSGTADSSTNPLDSLKLGLDKAVHSFQCTLIPARIEFLQAIITSVFDQPFWEVVDEQFATDGPAYKKSKVDINLGTNASYIITETVLPKILEQQMGGPGLRNKLDVKLEILKKESRTLAAICSSLWLWETLSKRGGDSLLDVITCTQEEVLKLRSCLTKTYEERAGLCKDGTNEGKKWTEVGDAYARALQEYDRRIEELSGCQAVTLITSYAILLNALNNL